MKLEIRKVSKRFESEAGVVEALRDVSLNVADGEFVCLVGPSGCGKSTLLSMMAGLENPTSGEIFCNSKLVQEPGPDRIVVFQESALFPWLNTIENVEFGLKMKGMGKSERRERARQALELVHLGRFAEARPHELSGGMKQRAAIARSLVLDPEILLMDEPFAALDAQTRDSLYQELHEIWRITRKTIVFVTHNVREAACLGDRIVLMSQNPGRIRREYQVNLERPRAIEDSRVMEIAREVLSDLRAPDLRIAA